MAEGKVCSMSPFQDANMEDLKKNDPCNLDTILVERINIRTCFMAYLGFKKMKKRIFEKRIALERMYEIYCLTSVQREKEISLSVLKCLTSIARSTCRPWMRSTNSSGTLASSLLSERSELFSSRS